MKEPIKAGDRCEVISGLGRRKSPNIGLVVDIISRTGEHSTLGVVWLCKAPDIQQLSWAGGYTKTGWADFPVAWLKKIEPDAGPGKAQETKKEISA